MEEADEILQQLAMDEEYELDTLLDIILNYVDVNQKEYAKKWIDCLFAHFDMQTLPETNQRLRDVLCDYYSTFNKPDLAIPYLNMTLNEYPLFRSSIGTNWVNAICNKSQYEKAHEAFDFALAIDDKQHRDIDLESIPLPARQANIKESMQLLSPSGKGEQRRSLPFIWHWHRSPLRDEGLRNRHEAIHKSC